MDGKAIDAHLGRSLRIRRRLVGMSQRQLAEACGSCTQQQIQKYESGVAMQATTLWRFARALGVPVDYFYEGLARA